MIRTVVRQDGSILIDGYADIGFHPGTPVEVFKTSAGGLMVRVDDQAYHAIDGDWRRKYGQSIRYLKDGG
jgi:hypothetical protein